MSDLERQRRARNRWVWRIVPLLILLSGQVTLGVLTIIKMERDGTTLNPWVPVVLTLSATLVFGILVGFIIIYPPWVRAAALSLTFPEATVLGIWRTSTLVDALRPFAKTEHIRLPRWASVVADGQGLGFWRGGKFPVRVALVPWADVEGISVGEAEWGGRLLPALVVDLVRNGLRFAPMKFLVVRSHSVSGVLVMDKIQAEQVKDKLVFHRPGVGVNGS